MGDEFVYEDNASKAVQWAANCNVKSLSEGSSLLVRYRAVRHLPQVMGPTLLRRKLRSAAMDADPPRFEAPSTARINHVGGQRSCCAMLVLSIFMKLKLKSFSFLNESQQGLERGPHHL